jgi:bacteriochlorophyll C8 methyltransferase
LGRGYWVKPQYPGFFGSVWQRFTLTDENLGVNKQRTWELLEVLAECDIRFSSFISINFLEDERTVELLVNLVTSLLFRKSVIDQIASVESGKRRPVEQVAEPA